MIEALNIPLTENPTRQKIWRVVVFAAPLILAAGISAFLVRSYLTLDTLSSFAPADTKLAIHLIKTPETSAVLEDEFHGTLLFPNAPFTLDEMSTWSKRGSELFLGESGVIGVAVSGTVPQNVLDEAKNLGFSVTARFGGTYIGTEEPGTAAFRPRLPVLTLLPWYNGEAYSAKEKMSAPLRLASHSLTISGFGRSSASGAAKSDQSLVKMNVSAKEAQDFLGFDVPLIFPGLRALENEMVTHGFEFSLGSDTEGTSYSLSVPEGDLTREDMENAVSELYYTKTLVEAPYEDVYTSLDEIVSSATAKPVTTTDPSATITSIGDNSGAIVRAAQTAHGLILTDRPVDIDGSDLPGIKNTCLASANQWIVMNAVEKLLPTALSTSGVSVIQRFLMSDQIAFSKHRTRVCW